MIATHRENTRKKILWGTDLNLHMGPSFGKVARSPPPKFFISPYSERRMTYVSIVEASKTLKHASFAWRKLKIEILQLKMKSYTGFVPSGGPRLHPKLQITDLIIIFGSLGIYDNLFTRSVIQFYYTQ